MARPRIGGRSRHRLVSTLTLAAVLAAPARAVAQAGSPEIAEPLVTVTAGLGNAMGWLGIQGERYLNHGLLSVFGGLGYMPKVDAYDPEGITLAAGIRGYTAGLRHRGFAEASACQVATLSDPEEPRRFYGPCGQLGYQYAARGGFTFLLSAGVGYALGAQGYQHRTQALLGLGLGYTWRRGIMRAP
jgi:hypothetical protein